MPLPNMGAAFAPLFQNIQIVKIATTLVDGEAVSTPTYTNYQGAVVPLKYSELIIKPEEQRAWKWKALYCYPDIKLSEEEKFIHNGTQYKVKGINDLSEYGMISYHCIEDFEDDSST